MKLLTTVLLVLPISIFSQDTTSLKQQNLSEFIIKSVPKKISEVSIINTIRRSSVISDGISINFIKKTPDRNVGDALKRVSGITVQNDKFILVRGLADRYNSAMINKTLLPSTEPDRRAFSFDIIPTSLVDNIIVKKSSSANMPGDISGGLIQITTKEVSDNFFNVSIGSSWGTNSTLKNYKLIQDAKFPTTFPSTYSYRVSGNGDKRLFTNQFSNPILNNNISIPNLNSGVSFGYKINNWSALLSSTIRNSYNINHIDRKDYQSSTELAYDYRDTMYTNKVLANGLLNITYIGDNTYSWKTLINYQTDDSYMNRSGNNYDNVQNVKSNSSNHINNTVVNSQIDGEIKTWNFNLGYNFIFREQPDYKVNPITKSLGTNEQYVTSWRDTYRFWSVLDENSFNAEINKTFNNIKIGTGYLKKIRAFNARIFRYTSSDMLDEITNNTDKYTANFDLINSYAMYDGEYNNWKLNAGIRNEYNIFNVSTSDFSGDNVKLNKKYLDVLPSINLSYDLNKTKYRFSLSKTLARPEFREIANFAYYDFIRNAQLLGNPNLQKSDIYNVDLKFEVYPKSGENISISLFGKNFVKPIEQIVVDGSVPSNLLLSHTNSNNALLYGVELEFRKELNEWINVYTNASIMNSKINVNGVKRQLQGQSNYVLNGGVNFKKENNILNITYNRVGDRISSVGFQGYPNIFENSRDVLDITILHKIKTGEIKISAGDVFGQPSKYYQKVQNRNLITTNNEQTISLTLNLNL